MCKIYRNVVVCGSLKRIPPKSLTVINILQASSLWSSAPSLCSSAPSLWSSAPSLCSSAPSLWSSAPSLLGLDLLRLGSDVCQQCRASYFMVHFRVINLSTIIPQGPQSHASDLKVINNPFLSIINT